jgi:hypothetical protein
MMTATLEAPAPRMKNQPKPTAEQKMVCSWMRACGRPTIGWV